MELLQDITWSLVAEIAPTIFSFGSACYGNDGSIMGDVAHPPLTQLTSGEVAKLIRETIPAFLGADIVTGCVHDVLDLRHQQTRIAQRVFFDFTKRQLKRQAQMGCKAYTADICCVMGRVAKVPLISSDHVVFSLIPSLTEGG